MLLAKNDERGESMLSMTVALDELTEIVDCRLLVLVFDAMLRRMAACCCCCDGELGSSSSSDEYATSLLLSFMTGD